MNKLLCSIKSALLISALYGAPGLVTDISVVHAEESAAENNTETVRVPAMRNRVYAQLARAQQIADQGDKAGGLAVLDEVKQQLDNLNSYERAMLFNFYGFMHYGAEDLPKAMTSFQQVIAQQAIPESLRLSTLYSLAQLAMQQQDYPQTLDYLSKWQELNTKPLMANQHMLFAQVYYQNKQFEQSLTYVNNALEVAKADNQLPKENWLILQRANYYELKQPENVTKVMEQLVRLYAKPQYWLQLSGMYGEIGEEQKQMAVMEAAWQAGFVTKSQDIITLVQLYLFHGAPFKAAQVLDDAIAQGKVVASEQHLAMLAQAYVAAKEEEKAIPVLQKASEIADSGEFDAQLAQVYLNLEQWANAINTAESALEKGDVKRVGDMHLVLGMSYFNLQKFDESLHAFKAAEEIPSSSKTAKQWYKYVEREQGHYAQLAMLN